MTERAAATWTHSCIVAAVRFHSVHGRDNWSHVPFSDKRGVVVAGDGLLCQCSEQSRFESLAKNGAHVFHACTGICVKRLPVLPIRLSSTPPFSGLHGALTKSAASARWTRIELPRAQRQIVDHPKKPKP